MFLVIEVGKTVLKYDILNNSLHQERM